MVTPFEARFGVPTALQNDQRGCLSRMAMGCRRGCRNMIFLTFGTGMGAGLILNGELYTGTNDLAGEVGHIRWLRTARRATASRAPLKAFAAGRHRPSCPNHGRSAHLRQGKNDAVCPTFLTIFPRLQPRKLEMRLKRG